MSAMREIENEWVLDLDTKKMAAMSATDFMVSLALPETFLAGEPEANHASVLRLWTSFCAKVREYVKAKHSIMQVQNRRYRKAVFHSTMENLCLQFSRRTETLKVRLIVHDKATTGSGKTTYQLKIVRLSDIPDECRNVQFCTAEIPPSEMQAYAEFVQTTPNNVVITGRNATAIQVQPAVVLSDSTDTSSSVVTLEEDQGGLVWSTRSLDNVVVAATAEVEDIHNLHYINPPIAMAVAEIQSQPAVPPAAAAATQSKTVLERMQELESIKPFLSETEYQTKRQAILDGI
ncbi:expressed unknown protein [Seminavis robusta]|uniref:Uncharacterized protein n=1 Tax=Seminavis robusta TaxID=568900 RepID=A0A9N8EL85_9STRA|nr:expressed unknown protein [Seminavis robusta]|eukprot:Sro1114_g242780.1 n/a (290) ;mRNA; r:17513-18382